MIAHYVPDGIQEGNLYRAGCSKDMDPCIRVFDVPDDTAGNFKDILALR